MLQIFKLSIITVTRWIFIIRNTITYILFFDQKIINLFGMYIISQTNTHIFNIIISTEFFALLAEFYSFYFSSGVRKLFIFLFFLCFYSFWQYFLLFFNIPNFITCFSRILCNNRLLINDSILFPDIIIFCLKNYSEISLNHIMNYVP